MTWDPTQYLKFATERLQPALDLLSRIPASAPAMVADLGCGTGNLLPLLRGRWPAARIIGVDSSAAMLDRARSDNPSAEFVQASIDGWRPAERLDVLFSNAALHWLDGHDRLLPEYLSLLNPGGWLAVQMPRNFSAPSHTCIVDAIEQGPWAAKLLPHLRRAPVWEPARYWQLLQGRSTALSIWETEYLQVLSGENPVAEFTKGTWLKQFLDRLEGTEREAFEADYRRRVLSAYPPQSNGQTLFSFRRLFILARA